MNKLSFILAFTLLSSLLIAPFLYGCSGETGAKLKVVASTSIITQIVERVGGERVDVINIIPPAQCPGHFDVSPGDIKKLSDADLFLLHGWQGEMFAEDIVASANNPEMTVIKLNVKVGENMNWMAPPVQAAAVDKITDALCQADAANADFYKNAASAYIDIITAKSAEVKNKLAAIHPADINVLAGQQQAGFIAWAGFNIIDVFGEPDSLTPQVVKDLIDKGKSSNVSLVIDNLQSGQDAGKGVAEELGCAKVILSNFPGGYDNTDSWEATIDYNVELLLNAVK
ncbi:metal ABC transporter substrate-binding protein [Chloroflexota bacterium]